ETGETLTGTGIYGIINDCWKQMPAPDRAGQAEDEKIICVGYPKWNLNGGMKNEKPEKDV
ncbi:MAG: hypothetical protein IKJ51_11240, partial [Clostridia bacterium]|nr:hypothetical protein [Clostridia bacterium]